MIGDENFLNGWYIIPCTKETSGLTLFEMSFY